VICKITSKKNSEQQRWPLRKTSHWWQIWRIVGTGCVLRELISTKTSKSV